MIRAIGILALGLWAAAAGRDGFDDWVDATVLPPLEAPQSVQVLDRHDTLLRAYTVENGRWRLGAPVATVDPDYLAMLVRYEDKRFYTHTGVDLRAMARGVAQAVWHGKVVSGGSTLTMQTARLLEDSGTGAWRGKLRQMRVAWALERRLSKTEILQLYLNRAPFGGNLEGVQAATLAWFGKPPSRLTPAEAALLVALPQSPEARRPDRDAQAATQARNRVLTRMQTAGILTDEEATTRTPVSARRREFPALAPHLADRIIGRNPTAARHRLTLDADLQATVQALATAASAGRSDQVQTAILIADHQSGEILASVGSAGYVADGRAGFIDLTRAIRSPGSTLKPFVYGLGFDQGLIHPETLIPDAPVDFDGYAPQNFDGLFRGELRVRQALQLSLNIPVVHVTQAIGPAHLTASLRRAGATPKVPGGRPGLAVALGGVGISLHDLVQSYAAIANGGVAVDLRATQTPSQSFTPHRVLGDVAAWQVADILLGVPRPRRVQGTGIAYKTGTSYGHRDAWAIGFDGRHVIGVWMGRADGTPVPGAFGGDLAAPVMFSAFARLKPQVDPISAPPPATLLLPTSQLPLPLQRFRVGTGMAEDGPKIIFPPEGATVEGDILVAKVRDGIGPFTWLANGLPMLTTHRREVVFDTLGRGFSDLVVMDAAGHGATLTVELR